MTSVPDQSNELSLHDDDDESTSFDSPEDIGMIDCTIRIF